MNIQQSACNCVVHPLTVDQYWDTFQMLTVMNKTSTNICLQIFVRTYPSFLWSRFLKVKLLGLVAKVLLNTCIQSTAWFYISLRNACGIQFISAPRNAVIVRCFLNWDFSIMSGNTPCDFSLYFPNEQIHWTPFHPLFNNSYKFFV